MTLIVQPVSLPILHKLSQDFVILVEKGGVYAYQIATSKTMPREGLIAYSSKHYGNICMMDKATNQLVNKNSGAVWWDWDDASRRVVRDIVFEPTDKPEDLHRDVLNTWHVKRGEMAYADPNAQLADIQPLIDHLMYISDGDVEGVLYFLHWLAWLWRYPDTKIPTAIMFYSKNGRIGKSMLGDFLAYVFGESMVKSIVGSKLYANFDDAMSGQRIIMLNELSRADKADNYENFKSLISEPKREFEGKGRGSVYQRNCTHWIITTNNADCLPLMNRDGRVLVMRCEAERQDNGYYKELARWMEEEGPELLAGCFDKWDFKDWKPHTPVPQTKATVQTQIESRNGLSKFLQELIDIGKQPFDKDLGRCTGLIEQLGTLYPSNMKGFRVNDKTLTSALQDLGSARISVNYKNAKGDRSRGNVWCWRNYEDKWKGADDAALLRHLGEVVPLQSVQDAPDRRAQP